MPSSPLSSPCSSLSALSRGTAWSSPLDVAPPSSGGTFDAVLAEALEPRAPAVTIHTHEPVTLKIIPEDVINDVRENLEFINAQVLAPVVSNWPAYATLLGRVADALLNGEESRADPARRNAALVDLHDVCLNAIERGRMVRTCLDVLAAIPAEVDDEAAEALRAHAIETVQVFIEGHFVGEEGLFDPERSLRDFAAAVRWSADQAPVLRSSELFAFLARLVDLIEVAVDGQARIPNDFVHAARQIARVYVTAPEQVVAPAVVTAAEPALPDEVPPEITLAKCIADSIQSFARMVNRQPARALLAADFFLALMDSEEPAVREEALGGAALAAAHELPQQWNEAITLRSWRIQPEGAVVRQTATDGSQHDTDILFPQRIQHDRARLQSRLQRLRNVPHAAEGDFHMVPASLEFDALELAWREGRASRLQHLLLQPRTDGGPGRFLQSELAIRIAGFLGLQDTGRIVDELLELFAHAATRAQRTQP